MLRINNWRFWLGLAVSILFVIILAYQVDLKEITAALGEASYFYVAPAIGLYFIAVYFRSIRWRYLLAPVGAFPVNRLYPVVVMGYMANNLLPARLGELVRSYYLAKREGVSGSTALATIAVERVYDGVVLLAVAALAAPLLVLLGEFDGTSDAYRTAALTLAFGTVAVFLAALAFLTMASFPWFLGMVDLGLRAVPARLRPRAREMSHRFIQGLGVLNSPRKHLGVFLLSLPVWLLEGAMYFLISYSFGISGAFGSFWVLLLVIALLTAVSNLATALPTSIGGIGPFEVVAQQTLVALGVGASVAAVYAAFLHLVALWLPVNLVGLALLWKQNLSLRQLVKLDDAPDGEFTPGYRGNVPRPNEELS